MQDRDQTTEYLQHKNVQQGIKQKYHSPSVYTNKNTVKYPEQKIQSPRTNPQGTSKSKKKQTIVSKAHIQKTQDKHPYSKHNEEIISFSTQSTHRKIKQIEVGSDSKQRQMEKKNQHMINLIVYRQNSSPENRIKKAKSDYNIVKSPQFETPKQKIKNVNEYEYEDNKNIQYQQKDTMRQIIQQSQRKPLPKDRTTFWIDPDQVSKLIKTIKFYQNKISRLQKQIQIKDKKLKEFEQKDNTKMRQQSKSHYRYECQNELYSPRSKYAQQEDREHLRRLLNMLKMTQQYKDFAQIALDDDGIHFLKEANKRHKSILDQLSIAKLKSIQNAFKPHSSHSPRVNKVHKCSCFSQFIPQSHLWTPSTIYSFGVQYLKNHCESFIGNSLANSEYELLLYELNRMWRQRQKRLINTIKQQKNAQIQKLKRIYGVENARQPIRSVRSNSKNSMKAY